MRLTTKQLVQQRTQSCGQIVLLFIVLKEEPVDGVEGEEMRDTGVDVCDSCTVFGVAKTPDGRGERRAPFKADLVGVFRRAVMPCTVDGVDGALTKGTDPSSAVLEMC